MTDKERIDWLEETQLSLISDDAGNWVATCDGLQNVPINPPDDIQTTFFIKKSVWSKNIREAIDKVVAEEKSSCS